MPLRPLRDSIGTWSPGGKNGTPEPIHAISAAWPGIVGKDVAANSSPLELTGGVLVVMTSSSAWSQQLQMLSLPILRALRDVANLPSIERMTFRSGRLPNRKPKGRGAAPSRSAAAMRTNEPAQAAPAPAADPQEALERLRRRINAVRRKSATTCVICGAPLETTSPQTCAPCSGTVERERSIELQRLVYNAPWLAFEEIREQAPGATVADFERARKVLLQRWWVILERAKRSGTLSRSGVERKLASAYVLLQSRLRPDRMTPAVVRNLLGPELHELLWPEPGATSAAKTPSKAPSNDLSKSAK